MNETLSQIAYVSRRTPGVDDDQVVDDIALPSYRRNRDLAITGCLWFDREYFVQFIEGPETNLTRLYRSIQKDPRHFDIRTVANRPIIERAFGRFALNVVRENETDPVRKLIELAYNDEKPDDVSEAAVERVLRATDLAMVELSGYQSGL